MSGDRRLASLTGIFQSEMHRLAGDVASAKRLAREAADEATEARRGHLLAEAELDKAALKELVEGKW